MSKKNISMVELAGCKDCEFFKGDTRVCIKYGRDAENINENPWFTKIDGSSFKISKEGRCPSFEDRKPAVSCNPPVRVAIKGFNEAQVEEERKELFLFETILSNAKALSRRLTEEKIWHYWDDVKSPAVLEVSEAALERGLVSKAS